MPGKLLQKTGNRQKAIRGNIDAIARPYLWRD
jgi:hypothetical protein